MAKLEVGIGADIGELKSKLAEAQVLLEKLNKQKATEIKIGINSVDLQKQINDAKANVGTLTKAINANSAAQVTNSRATANGSNTLTQFSRIAQDVPFGIIGIGNNLTATAESFGYLAKSSGGAINAFKAIGASLIGPGGLILAFSAVTSGLTYMAQEGITVGDVFGKLTGTFDDYGNSVKKAREDGLKSASAEIQSLNELVAVAQNDNIAKKDRLNAVKKLQSQFTAYYGNLSAEKIMYGDLTRETNLATQALVARSIAEKLGDKAADKFLERLNAQQKFNDEKKRLEKFDLDIAQRQLQVEKDKGKFLGVTADIVRKEQAGRANILKSIEKERQNLIKLVIEYDKYGKIINSLNVTAAPLDREPPKEVKQKKYKNLNPNFDPGNGFMGGGVVNPNSGIVTPDLKVDKQAIEAAQKLKEGLAFQTQLIEEFDANANTLIENSIASTFGNLGTAIGEALASGGNVLSAVGNSILQSLGRFLSDMGDMLIKYGTLAVLKGKLDLAILTGGPVSIAAGVAAIGVGIALKAISGAIGARANAGASGAGSGVSTQRGSMSTGADIQTPTSSVSNGGTFNNSGTVVFEISGQKLIGVLSNTLGANKRLGGSLAI